MKRDGPRVGSFEAKTRFSELVAAAERGQETIILRNGKPVAKIAPVDPQTSIDRKRRQAADQLIVVGRAMAARRGRPLSQEDIQAGIREGRRWQPND